MTNRRLLAIYAHPDDEAFSAGGTFARYAQEGEHIELICATRGEVGEISDPKLATKENLGQVREQELRCAAQALGLRHIHFLDYRDSGMAGTDDNKHPAAFANALAENVVPQLVQIIREFRPFAIVTFEPWGGYGHPDHIAIHNHTVAAFDAAADPDYLPQLGPAWHTKRLYYALLPSFLFLKMKERMEANGMDVSFFENDGFDQRREKGWPDDQIHCIVDTAATQDNKWAAFACHQTQFDTDSLFLRLPREEMATIFNKEYFALAKPLPLPGTMLDDLFGDLGS